MSRAKPVEWKRRAGNPGHQKLPPPLYTLPRVADVPDPLEDLGAPGSAAWSQLWRSTPWLAATDLLLVSLVCRALDERAALMRVVAAEGVTYTTRDGSQLAHPALSALRSLDRQVSTWLGLCGLSPSALDPA
jgi:P27 family predicted phage terminase small subunit